MPLVLLGLYSLGGSRGSARGVAAAFLRGRDFLSVLRLFSVVLVRRRLLTAHLQTVFQATIDIACLILLLHACGGISSGLGCCFSCRSAAWPSCFRRAARCSSRPSPQSQYCYTPFGSSSRVTWTSMSMRPLAFSGLVLFTIAASASVLATRVRESEDLVRQKDLDLANLADLSQYIVQHLRESLLVVDAADRIRLINESAAEILGDTHAIPGALLGEVSPRLLYSLSTWRQTGQREDSPSSFVAADGARLIQPHFAPLGGAAPGPTLIFLEDTSLMAERVQQSKLAALGRLSASIAHEIRNPVGAMSHAGQLLAESPNPGSRRPPAHGHHPQQLRAGQHHHQQCLATLAARGYQAHSPVAGGLAGRVPIRVLSNHAGPDGTLWRGRRLGRPRSAIRSEPPSSGGLEPLRQRHQIWGAARRLKVEIKLARLNPSYRPYLESPTGDRDRAVGADRIFEPFFTGRKGGTGLGLFIARELCQLNRAILLYEPRVGGGSIFRIVFSDPQRWEE